VKRHGDADRRERYFIGGRGQSGRSTGGKRVVVKALMIEYSSHQ